MIRKAQRSDIPALIALCKRHHEEKKIVRPFDPVRLSMTLAHAIQTDDWLVLIGEGAILIAMTFDCPLGSGRLTKELLVRGPLAEMVPLYEAWARVRGSVECSLGCTERPEAFARLYGRHGYRLAETIFTKRL